MLDPRRPIGPPSKDDQLEQLIPYQQTLLMSPLLYATHSKQVAQLSGVPIRSCALHSATQSSMVKCLIVNLDNSTDWMETYLYMGSLARCRLIDFDAA